MASGVGATAPTIAYMGLNGFNFATSSHTITGLSFGDEAPTRLLVAVIHAQASGARTPTAVSIGGVTATLVPGTSVSAAANISIWYAEVPTGTSGSVSVTYSGTILLCLVGLYRMTDLLSNVPLDGANGLFTNLGTMTLDSAAGGFVVCGLTNSSDNAVTFSGAVENYDADHYGTGYRKAGAHGADIVLDSRTLGASSTGSFRFSAATWR